MNKFKHVSASQIDTYLDCGRKWFFDKIVGLPRSSSPAAVLGGKVHTQLEIYLKSGRPPTASSREGAIAMSGLHLLPEPGSVEVEWSIEKNPVEGFSLSGLPVKGFIDVYSPRVDPVLVLDHKTSGDKQWKKTEEELRENVQLLIYAHYAVRHHLQLTGSLPQAVTAGHIFYLTKGAPFSQKTTVTLPPDHIGERWEKIDGIVGDMRKTAVARAPTDVPPTLSACSKYGGCPFRTRCESLGTLTSTAPSFIRNHLPKNSNWRPGTPKEKAPMSTTPNAALAALNRLRGGAASTPAPTPPPKPATTAPKAVSPLDALKALRASGASAEMGSSDTAAPAAGIAAPTQLPVATPEERNSEDENKFLANLGLEDQGKSLVLPPDAPPDTRMSEEAKAAAAAAPASAPAAEAEAEAPKKARRPSNYKAKLEALGWNEDQIAGMEPARMREVIDGQVRAGDAWSELEAAGGLAAAQAAEGAPAAEPSFPDIDSETQTPPPVAPEVATEVAAPAALPAPGLVVYVDCAPVKGADVENAVHLEDMVRPYMEEAAKMNEVSYYNLIEYGKGPSYIAAFVLANPPQGVILANTRYPSTGAVLEVLLPMADVVVRAAR